MLMSIKTQKNGLVAALTASTACSPSAARTDLYPREVRMRDRILRLTSLSSAMRMDWRGASETETEGEEDDMDTNVADVGDESVEDNVEWNADRMGGPPEEGEEGEEVGDWTSADASDGLYTTVLSRVMGDIAGNAPVPSIDPDLDTGR
jgi:hypothetical protein